MDLAASYRQCIADAREGERAELEAQQRRALAAIHAAANATAELIRFAREGPACNLPFSDGSELIVDLADALRLAIRIQQPFLEQQPCYALEMGEADQLAAACARYLDGCGREHD